ncbi:Asp23/Gls24 family envelope stress response protein [Kitasatospora herbaricolor]|uniref:Asp23/Gls24 family envelope stress response protein n=1 Tax=Kitasatospora herbaricolor TaxID=68217 RepID=A0ABZ1WI31_9ACTN|nr:Asp23/Gls24 family envelope stress response protein [Kitasatospora herbaricolor]
MNAGPVPPRERGATTVPPHVVTRIATRTGRQVLAERTGASTLPRVSASVHLGTARLHLALALPYPIDLAPACRDIQRAVADQVGRLTGLRITEVTLDIRHLDAGTAERGRVH